mgnify:CR=1 FL=1
MSGFRKNRKLRALSVVISLLIFTGFALKPRLNTPNTPVVDPNFSFEIRDAESGAYTPGKLVFLQADTTFDLGVASFGNIASRQSTVYTADGRGEISVPPGKYTIWAGRGTEYSADKREIEISAESKHSLTAYIRKEVETPGYISGDLHLHTLTFSGHGDASVQERLISCIGEGLEWAVATDHNHVTDYDTVRRELDLTDLMAASIGNEISTPIGHFNAFPLPRGSEPTKSSVTDGRELFKNIKNEAPASIIQVNHPRWPSGDYFTILNFDQEFAFSDQEDWSWAFDAYEILNENRGLGWIEEEGNPISVKQDWFNMLNSGRRFAGVGNSDSHSLMNILAGTPRTYVASSTDDPSKIDEAELVESIRERNVSVSRGLYIEAVADKNVPIGGQISLKNGAVNLRIRVQAPHWVDCDTVQIIGNGKVVKSFAVQSSERPVRFRKTVTLRPKVDTWYVVVATGNESMAPLVHDAPVPITPLAFTNPIWVDADRDGEFTSIMERAGAIVRRLHDQPDNFIEELGDDSELKRFAVSYLAQNDIPNRQELFSALLPQVSLDRRLFIYNQLSETPGDETQTILAAALRSAAQPLEKTAIAVAQVNAGDNSRWRKALKHAEHINDHRYVRAAFRNLTTNEFLREWRVAGPFPFPENHGLDVVAPPEPGAASSREIQWRTVQAPEDGIVDFVEIFGKHEKVNAYATTEFESRETGKMLFMLGSDDGVAVWLNGEEVHRNHTHRGVSPASDMFVGLVREGKNELLLKVENGGGGWGFVIETADVLGWLKNEKP